MSKLILGFRIAMVARACEEKNTDLVERGRPAMLPDLLNAVSWRSNKEQFSASAHTDSSRNAL